MFAALRKSGAFYLLAFFVVVISAGALLLTLPAAWAGGGRLPFIDAAFLAASAACVTGLATVNVSDFSLFGQIVILALLQIGALGIISFSSILLMLPGHRFSMSSAQTIQEFYLNGIEYNPRRIVRNIVLFTLVIEAAGSAMLGAAFFYAGIENPVYMGVFHAISAFCNAGLGIFDDSLVSFRQNNFVLITAAALILGGGCGFLVLHDIFRCIRRKKKRLSYHSLIVIWMTIILALAGVAFFLVFEINTVYKGMDICTIIVNAVFNSISARTAGFAATAPADFSMPARMFTTILMFIGGAPGSVSGGLKVTTFFVIVAVMVSRPDAYGDIRVRKHRLSGETAHRAVVYFLKAMAMLAVSVFALAMTELRTGASLEWIVFEAVSAFATAGLSLGITPDLTTAGKVVVIASMFAGRIGLFALAFPVSRRRNYDITYGEGELLI